MLDKIWRFLKQLIQRLFRTNPKIEPTPPQPGPTLTDAEYEAKLMELLEGVNQGWGRGDVAGFLIAKQIKNGDLAAWLRGFGDRLLEGAQGSTASADAVVSLQELARRLELLGGVAGGELGEVAGNVGREILVGFPLVSGEAGEDVDGEAEKWKKRGNEQYEQSNFQEALAFYECSIELKYNQPEVWEKRGLVLQRLGDYQGAIDSNNKASTLYRYLANPESASVPQSIEGVFNLSDIKPSYDKGLYFTLDFHEVWNNRGLTLYDLGRLEDAIASYDKGLEFKPDFHEAWYNRSIALHNLGRLEEAITSFDKAIEIKPDLYEAWINRGQLLCNLGLFKEAIISYDKALEFKPDKQHEAWNNRGVALRNLGRLEDAIASCDKALEFKPDFHEAWNSRGAILCDNFKRYEDAIASFDKALEIKPDDHKVWINRTIAVKNAPKHRLLVYEILQAKFPKSPPVTRTLITHNLKQRGYEGQILTLKAGLEYCRQKTHPEGYGELHQALGDAHYSRGKLNSPNTYWNKATTSYQEALKTLTKDTFLQLHLQVLQNLIKTLVSLKQTDEANKLQRDATDLLHRLLKQQNYSQITQQQLTDKLVSFEQLTVNIFIQSGQFAQALATAETDKNVCLSWLLDALPIPDYKTEETVTHAQIQQLLNPTTAAIYWHLSDASLTTFIIKSDGLLSPETCFSDFPDEFEKWVKEWNQQYTDYQSKEKTSQVNHPWRAEMASKFARLKEILKIDVIEQQLEGITELILIPHRDLHRFPIHALFSRDFVVSYLPSAAVGISLQHRFTPKWATTGGLPLQQNNPSVGAVPPCPPSMPCPPESVGAVPPCPPSISILSIENPHSVITDKNGQQKRLAPLPAAEIESEIICRMFDNYTRLEEDAATLDEVETLLQQPHNIFHFTGHGSYNFDHPLESTLYLSGNHRLTVREIIQLNLSNYELICLPACETALTDKQTILAEYVGLTSGFMRAGVGCVVSTLWPIESGASTLLMIYFYQRWREAGDSLPVALANAQKWLRESTREDLAAWYQGEIDKISANSPEPSEVEFMLSRFFNTNRQALATMELDQPYQHPYYWAAFTITGL
ncbi:MAG: CHAT domain-containing protein [Microcoleus sp. PH2017_39_LGB_O_B]|uniref:CHAT domain-containing protein n=1 Tax=unclassified Microcoleus TaxID=2642155 RepID=UPI001D22DD54|nr:MULTISPECIES: CHAT domain-containing protein [unclassified Microcoleus]MCC3449714.1 CHAT domain-containing protein [Microcoleus sp. PH2017_09_SFU_O_A]MCC3630653.1 CHAT domain-containing protein [Microcoleus sp. PH2017_39_LGB_O_B]MCC3642822.1 CHAT domain-containing protein [Microcoleus sp. PH2017_33_LGB_O_A]TAF88863.1 MAG: CHAT domain-containing protein [Oscillatoriales cyanobacterium]